MTPLSIAAVGRMFGHDLPDRGRAKCPLKKHHRKDKTFRVYRGASGETLFKCWSCDPPDNVGDAVALYAIFAGMDRKAAWKKLGQEGYAVPGWEDRAGEAGARLLRDEPRRPKPKPTIPSSGARPGTVVPLDQEAFKSWLTLDTGLVVEFAKKRGLTPELLKKRGVIEMPGGRSIGFTYVDPVTRMPCRVKVRGVFEKTFRVEPRAPEGAENARALAPLYLAHRLKPAKSALAPPVFVTEGEVDALSLLEVGFTNVVSLPDGSQSVKTANLRPLIGRFGVWLLAFDADDAGAAAARELRQRVSQYDGAYADLVLVHWKKMQGDELVTYKDANDALVQGKFTREDFARAVVVACEERLGYAIDLGGA